MTGRTDNHGLARGVGREALREAGCYAAFGAGLLHLAEPGARKRPQAGRRGRGDGPGDRVCRQSMNALTKRASGPGLLHRRMPSTPRFVLTRHIEQSLLFLMRSLCLHRDPHRIVSAPVTSQLSAKLLTNTRRRQGPFSPQVGRPGLRCAGRSRAEGGVLP